MKVLELITLLREYPPDSKISVWNEYRDCEWFDVKVSVSTSTLGDEKYIHIGSSNLDFQSRL